MKKVGVVVSFYYWTLDSEIEEFLEQNNLSFVRVSTLQKKYAIDLPTGQETSVINMLKNTPIVERIFHDLL